MYPPTDSRGVRWLAALSAAGIGYRVEIVGDRAGIIITESDADCALTEIRAYESANRDWPPRQRIEEESGGDGNVLASMVVVCLICLAYVKTGAVGSEYFAGAGAVLDSALVRAFEVWRLVTALGLHVDGMHLLANCACLLVFGAVAGARLGFGTAWTVILLGGGLGNGLSVMLTRSDFRAVGASTAVFAALGILVTLRFAAFSRNRRRGARPSFFERRWLPLLAGMGALAILGGSEGSHLAGHLYGFLAGLGVGVLALPVVKYRRQALLQHVSFALFLAANVLAWRYAG